jgi:hypothetical protein
MLVHQPDFFHSHNIHTANHHCIPLCPFYCDPRHDSWHGISWPNADFPSDKAAVFSDPIKPTVVSHGFLSHNFKLYCSFNCHFPHTVRLNNRNFTYAHSSYCKGLICSSTISRNDQQYALTAPLPHSIYWLLHVLAVACHHQGAY